MLSSLEKLDEANEPAASRPGLFKPKVKARPRTNKAEGREQPAKGKDVSTSVRPKQPSAAPTAPDAIAGPAKAASSLARPAQHAALATQEGREPPPPAEVAVIRGSNVDRKDAPGTVDAVRPPAVTRKPVVPSTVARSVSASPAPPRAIPRDTLQARLADDTDISSDGLRQGSGPGSGGDAEKVREGKRGDVDEWRDDEVGDGEEREEGEEGAIPGSGLGDLQGDLLRAIQEQEAREAQRSQHGKQRGEVGGKAGPTEEPSREQAAEEREREAREEQGGAEKGQEHGRGQGQGQERQEEQKGGKQRESLQQGGPGSAPQTAPQLEAQTDGAAPPPPQEMPSSQDTVRQETRVQGGAVPLAAASVAGAPLVESRADASEAVGNPPGVTLGGDPTMACVTAAPVTPASDAPHVGMQRGPSEGVVPAAAPTIAGGSALLGVTASSTLGGAKAGGRQFKPQAQSRGRPGRKPAEAAAPNDAAARVDVAAPASGPGRATVAAAEQPADVVTAGAAVDVQVSSQATSRVAAEGALAGAAKRARKSQAVAEASASVVGRQQDVPSGTAAPPAVSAASADTPSGTVGDGSIQDGGAVASGPAGAGARGSAPPAQTPRNRVPKRAGDGGTPGGARAAKRKAREGASAAMIAAAIAAASAPDGPGLGDADDAAAAAAAAAAMVLGSRGAGAGAAGSAEGGAGLSSQQGTRGAKRVRGPRKAGPKATSDAGAGEAGASDADGAPKKKRQRAPKGATLVREGAADGAGGAEEGGVAVGSDKETAGKRPATPRKAGRPKKAEAAGSVADGSGDAEPDPSTMTLRDVISLAYKKEKQNRPKDGKGAGASGLSAADRRRLQSSKVPTLEAGPTLLTPQVTVVDGQIVINQGSLTAPASASDGALASFTRVEESVQRLNAHSYSNRQAPERWSQADTALFYKGLAQFGTDFMIMAKLFPTRTRRQLKAKYKVEDKKNPAAVEAALRRRVTHAQPLEPEDFAEVMQTLDLDIDLSDPLWNQDGQGGQGDRGAAEDVEDEDEAAPSGKLGKRAVAGSAGPGPAAEGGNGAAVSSHAVAGVAGDDREAEHSTLGEAMAT
eukprot:jgi/Mesvir1/17270/Mv07678-RA.1